MNFLLDTNILIAAEPTSLQDVELGTARVASLVGLLARGQHGAWIHPVSIHEIGGDKDAARRSIRLLLGAKYPQLRDPPATSQRLLGVLGTPRPGSHNERDLCLLSAVDADAVDYLVTEDDGIHKRARRTNLADRVLTVAEAIAIIGALFPSAPTPLPHVSSQLAHSLREDAIFDTLRADYPSFDDWLKKCKREQRVTWAIEKEERYAGICIAKDEQAPVSEQLGKTLKICTFKISSIYRGLRYGELLLKSIFNYTTENAYKAAFIEVFPKQQRLINLLMDFGFCPVAAKPSGESVLLKTFRPRSADPSLGAYDFNVAYGPHAIKMAGARAFVIPIQPRFHQLLFPESEHQLQLTTELHPFANSIRKAYLCHATLRSLRPGDLVLFYCSAPVQAVAAVGVVDDFLVSGSPAAIARYVGKRTVYAYSEIERMAAKPILAILFRLSRILKKSWPLDLLTRSGIIQTAPQSIVHVRRPEALSWLATQLDAQS